MSEGKLLHWIWFIASAGTMGMMLASDGEHFALLCGFCCGMAYYTKDFK